MRKTTTVPAALATPSYDVLDVTPELAEKWLAQNTHNRTLRENKVMAYARDMEAGQWAENGEAVKFAADGTLLDGQHRLHAVTLSGATVRMLVVTGLPNVAQETMDDGIKRTLADVLHLRGEKYTALLAAVVRRAAAWDAGYQRDGHKVLRPTNSECLAFLGAHPELRDSAAIADAVRAASKIPGAVLGLTHWVFTQIDTDDTIWFFERLADGAELEKYHPVLTLRRRFEEESSNRSRLPEDLALAFVIKGWNAYRAGQQMRICFFRPGGGSPERFPTPQ